mgnify:CR=1 FL=1
MAVTDHVTETPETPKTPEELRLEEEKKRQEEADARKQQKEDGYESLAQGRGKKTTYNDYNKMFRWTADPALAKTLGMQEQKDVKEAAGTAALIQGMQLAGAASMYLSPQDIDNRKKKAALKERVAQGKHGLTDAQRDAMEREYMDPAKTFASSGQRDVEAALASQGGVAGTSAKNLVRGQREKDQRLLEMAHKASGKLSSRRPWTSKSSISGRRTSRRPSRTGSPSRCPRPPSAPRSWLGSRRPGSRSRTSRMRWLRCGLREPLTPSLLSSFASTTWLLLMSARPCSMAPSPSSTEAKRACRRSARPSRVPRRPQRRCRESPGL